MKFKWPILKKIKSKNENLKEIEMLRDLISKITILSFLYDIETTTFQNCKGQFETVSCKGTKFQAKDQIENYKKVTGLRK